MTQNDTLTIDLASEAVTIDLTPSLLDPDPQDIIELLKEGQSTPYIYTKVACAYVRAGFIDGAERITRSGLGVDEPDKSLSEGEGPMLLWALDATLLTAKARTSPKMIYSGAVEDIQPPGTQTKDAYNKDTAICINKMTSSTLAAETPSGDAPQLPLLARGAYQISSRMIDDAMKTFDQIMKTYPTNVVALVGKARILYLKKNYPQSLKLFQKALQLNPSMDPDPRIGIGLCLWAMGHEDRAIHAWERSAELDPNSPAPQALVGLAYLNVHRTREQLDDNHRRDLIVNGMKHLQAAFQNASQKSPASANVLSEVFLKRSGWNRALKLAERTIQFADTLPLLTEGYVRAGRVCFCWAESIETTDPMQANDLRTKATKYFTQALEGQPRNVLAGIGLAACQLLNSETIESITTLDSLLLRSASSSTAASLNGAPKAPTSHNSIDSRNVECATIFLAALRAFPRTGVTPHEIAQESGKARVLFERAGKAIGLSPFGTASSAVSKKLGLGRNVRRWIENDREMFIEIGRLWWAEPGHVPASRTKSALQEALKLENDRVASARVPNGETPPPIDPRLVNNIAVLSHLSALDTDAPVSASRRLADAQLRKSLLEQAQSGYSAGLMTFSASKDSDSDAGICTMLYNLARVYEDVGEEAMAKEAYEKLLGRHSEYVDAKIRLAALLFRVNRGNEGHELLKQALTSAPTNLNLRAFYAKFLLDSGLQKPARDFIIGTLKEHDKHDIWSLVAFGWIVYIQARDSRDTSSKGVEERKKNFFRAAELFEKALQLDPSCAHAAQGLAICTAEDVLGVFNTGLLIPMTGGSVSGDEQAKRVRAASREALDIFAKVRESVSDGSVYLNMGHCYYARDEFDRAIESYETASTRYWNGQNVSGLLCLCRSWYAKAMKDQSYKAINTALDYAQKALFVQPSDKAILYNIAMIQQKSAEMLFTLAPQKRNLKDLRRVIEQARHAQSLFASLAADKSSILPYNRDIADQRRRYGDNMLRRGDEQVAKQEAYESETQAKLDAARQRRQEGRERAEEAERQRLEQLKIEHAKIAEQRRIAREQVQAWTREAQVESDEEKEKKEKRKREKKEKKPVFSGDEDEASDVPSKRPRKSRLKRAGGAESDGNDDDEQAAVFTDEEEKPTVSKSRSRKRAVREDDDEDKGAAPRKKQYKSKEILSDTDDEDEEMAPPSQSDMEPTGVSEVPPDPPKAEEP